MCAQVTPLHTDPHHNLLAQVVGTKYVRLYAPPATPRLYPYREGLTTNSSQVTSGMFLNKSASPPERRASSLLRLPGNDIAGHEGVAWQDKTALVGKGFRQCFARVRGVLRVVGGRQVSAG
jgi:hypothetical protein